MDVFPYNTLYPLKAPIQHCIMQESIYIYIYIFYMTIPTYCILLCGDHKGFLVVMTMCIDMIVSQYRHLQNPLKIHIWGSHCVEVLSLQFINHKVVNKKVFASFSSNRVMFEDHPCVSLWMCVHYLLSIHV